MQTLKLDINPKGEIPVLYVSQYDNGREFGIELVDGEEAYNVPSGYSVQLNVRKTDSKLVTKIPESVTGNILIFVTTTQMTACPGNNIASLTLKDASDIVITTLYFIIEVQRDVLAGGITSETEIDNLTQQIEDITTEVIGEDYYDKTEVDALLADKADVSDLPDMSNYYTKTATDTLLNAKADAATTYTKSETDSLLSAKANTAELATVATTGDYDDLINKPTIPAAQVQSDYAQSDNTQVDYIKNKPDISGMIAAALLAVMPVERATGNPCTFDTDIATSLVGLSADIVASGGYDADTQTEHPIVGHSALNLDINGDTFIVSFGQTVYGGHYTNNGKLVFTWGAIDLSDDTIIWTWNIAWFQTTSITNIKYVSSNTQIANGLAEKYKMRQAQGMSAAIAGEMAVDVNNFKVRTDAVDATGTKPSGLFAYELETPIEIDVSDLSLDAVVGTNTITSDGDGDVTASYKVSIQKYVDDQ